MRQVSLADFPASWHAAAHELTTTGAQKRSSGRSHDSSAHDERYMLRLDEPSRIKLEKLVERFDVSKAEVIRQRIAQTNEENFPESWQLKAAEHGARRSRQDGSDGQSDQR